MKLKIVSKILLTDPEPVYSITCQQLRPCQNNLMNKIMSKVSSPHLESFVRTRHYCARRLLHCSPHVGSCGIMIENIIRVTNSRSWGQYFADMIAEVYLTKVVNFCIGLHKVVSI